MKGNVEELGKFLETYVNMRSFSFLREDPQSFASRIFKIFSSFFFPCTEDHFMDGLKAKTLRCLWNIVIDDIVEYTDKGKDNIFDSLQVVTTYRNGMNFAGKTESGQIMHDFFQRFYIIPSGPNKKIAEELLFLDLIDVLNGFEYERVIQKNSSLGTFSEYMEFREVNFNLVVYFGIGIVLYPYNMNISTIGDLREVYKWLTLDNYRLIGSELLFPSLMEQVDLMGLHVPHHMKVYEREKNAKLKKIDESMWYSPLTTLSFSLEFLGDTVDVERLPGVQLPNGSVANSPATTAFFLKFIRSEKALTYVREILSLTGDGSVMTVYPIDVFVVNSNCTIHDKSWISQDVSFPCVLRVIT